MCVSLTADSVSQMSNLNSLRESCSPPCPSYPLLPKHTSPYCEIVGNQGKKNIENNMYFIFTSWSTSRRRKFNAKCLLIEGTDRDLIGGFPFRPWLSPFLTRAPFFTGFMGNRGKCNKFPGCPYNPLSHPIALFLTCFWNESYRTSDPEASTSKRQVWVSTENPWRQRFN